MQPAVIGLVLGILTAFLPSGDLQANKEFRARLSTVPIDVTMQATIAGTGNVTAVLAGNTLSVTGSFADLRSPATVARLHLAPKGIRGPSIFELTVTGSTSGTINGTVALMPSQIEDLVKSRFYVQLHSETAPEGNLRGWLLPRETRR